ncbi:MAG: hypothetical protein ChlgKO_02620 [Chlamydiales bacterium]
MINSSEKVVNYFRELDGFENLLVKQIVPATYVFLVGIYFGEKTETECRSVEKANSLLSRVFYCRNFQILATSFVITGIFLLKTKSITMLAFQVSFVAGMLLGFLDSKKSYVSKIDFILDTAVYVKRSDQNESPIYCLDIDLVNNEEVSFKDLGDGILQKFQSRPIYQISLWGNSFGNNDLSLLLNTGAFKNVQCIQVTENERITGALFEALDSTKIQSLTGLDLSGTSITSNELLKISERDWFRNLSTLRLANNPQLTHLSMPWWESDNFSTIKHLDLSKTDITTEVLKAMLENSSWIKNLEGLNLQQNPIAELPESIWRLAKLKNAIKQTPPGGYPFKVLPNPYLHYGLLLPETAISNLIIKEFISRGLISKLKFDLKTCPIK